MRYPTKENKNIENQKRISKTYERIRKIVTADTHRHCSKPQSYLLVRRPTQLSCRVSEKINGIETNE